MKNDRMSEAFDTLLNEVDDIIRFLNQRGGEMFAKGEYTGVEDVKAKAIQMSFLHEKLISLRGEWRSLYPQIVKLVSEQPEIKEIDQREEKKPIPRSHITVPVTQAGLNHNYIKIRAFKDFFPPDSFGAASRRRGMGKLLRLHVSGIAEVVETDIASDKMFFRKRGWCEQLYRMYHVQPGDEIIFEKISDYVYKVYTKPK